MNNYDSTVKPTTKCGISHEPNEEDLTFTTVIFLDFFSDFSLELSRLFYMCLPSA